MRNTTFPIRKAFVATIKQGLVYQNQTIPVYAEFLPADVKPAEITYNNKIVELYVIVLNQTSNYDPIMKCVRNDQSSIQVQINAIFPSGSGNSELPEIIGDIIKASLFQSGNNTSSVVLEPPFKLWKCTYESARNIQYDTDSNRVWTHQMTFLCHVTQ